MAENEKCPNCGSPRVGPMMTPDRSGDMFDCGATLDKAGTLARSWRCIENQNAQLSAKLTAAEAIVAAVKDNAIADRIATNCHDEMHDEFHCPTCAARSAGIEAFREAVLAAGKDGA